jgi:hypothetical protein
VTELRPVIACAECGVHWDEDQPPTCANPQHGHVRLALHRHRDVVALPDGTEVVAVSFDSLDPYRRDHPPDYGLYFDQRWQPPWPHEHIDWPDYGMPDDPTPAVGSLRSLLARGRAGQRVEMGCLGGHGRTGTALACLAVLTGHPPGDAIAWVRMNYCADAVETPAQEAFVSGLRSP